MKRNLFFGIAPAVLLLALIAGGCSQSDALSAGSPNANSTAATNANNQPNAAATTEIKRTELMENAQFAAEMKTEPSGAIEAGREATLVFAVKDKQGALVKDLKIVHEKLMHLLVVSDDLAQFDHVHPEQQPDGTFRLGYKFPNGGKFKLYTDFTPQNSAQIVDVFDVSVAGAGRERTPLVADQELTKQVDGLTFTLKAEQPFTAAKGLALNFYVTDADGKPVTDLQPYLGAMAHFVVISEDATKFLHVHAEAGETTKTKGTGGHEGHNDQHGEMEMDVKTADNNAAKPTVMAHTEFPTAGIYKLWGQFQRNGKVITVPFVFNVGAGETATAENAPVPADAVKVTVSSAGFEPSSVSVKKGQPVKLAFFRKDANNCASEVVFEKLNVKKSLPAGKTTVVEINPQEAGELGFACGMGMFKGKVVVN